VKTFAFDRRVLATHQLRCNLKSLAAEARIIRQETRRAGPPYRSALIQHRRGRLREESRYANLALGYLRGRAYRQIEKSCKMPASAERIIDKLKRVFEIEPRGVLVWLTT
jgi:hypothetical protein